MPAAVRWPWQIRSTKYSSLLAASLAGPQPWLATDAAIPCDRWCCVGRHNELLGTRCFGRSPPTAITHTGDCGTKHKDEAEIGAEHLQDLFVIGQDRHR